VRTAAAEAGAPAAWRHRLLAADGSRFEVLREGVCAGTVEWDLTGRHNVQNGIAAIAAAAHAGVTPEQAIAALRRFRNVRRRMELFAKIANISLYDDFAHHPTAIATTLEGLRAHVEKSRIIAVLEFRSNTMKLGTHAELLGDSLKAADLALVYQSPELGWNPKEILAGYRNVVVIESLDEIVRHLEQQCRPGDHVVFMSNGGFGAIHEKTAAALRATLPDRE
jgi:UDP-N-acetylmuramate: L-alanyl-gamma-D-glutamyl-meso-diaminopimelate ligase